MGESDGATRVCLSEGLSDCFHPISTVLVFHSTLFLRPRERRQGHLKETHKPVLETIR